MARKKSSQQTATIFDVNEQGSFEAPFDSPQETEDDLSEIAVADFTASLSATDWTAETIVGQLAKGNIILNPAFQRRDAWKAARKSEFIESLILGLPIPQIVLAERKEKKGTYIVIDGKQRLLSLAQFTADASSKFTPLTLVDLKIKRNLNGFTYQNLMEHPELNSDVSAFENQTIRTVVIRNWESEDFIYTVFLRLNTNSVGLSSQELRQALHPGPFLSWLDECTAESPSLKKIFNSIEPDFRMRDVELALRYLSFQNFLPNYRGDFKTFLDDTAKYFNAHWAVDQGKLRRQFSEFESAINSTFEVFGPRSAFRRWNRDRFEGRFNRAVFDVMVQYFSIPSIAAHAKSHKQQFVDALKELCDDDAEFLSSIVTTTKSTNSVVSRFGKWGRKVRTITRIELDIPRLRGDRIEVVTI